MSMDTNSQPNKKMFELARLLAKLFESRRNIHESQLTSVFQGHFHKNLTLRDYGCKRVKELVEKLPMLERSQSGRLTFSKIKLVHYVLIPVLQSQGGTVKKDKLRKCFSDVVGFDVLLLCQAIGINSGELDELAQYLENESDVLKIIRKGSSWVISVCPTADSVSMQAVRPDSVNHASFQYPQALPMNPQVSVVASVPGATPPMGMDSPVRSILLPTPHTHSYFPFHPQPPLVMKHSSPSFSRADLQGRTHSNVELEAKAPLLDPNPVTSYETYLPRHPIFRHDMPIPKSHVNIVNPSFHDRRRQVENKERVVEKINNKVEQIIDDLANQGKFVPDCEVKRLLTDLLIHANRGRMHLDRVLPRDITAWEQYSKVHGRVEELIKVFCWLSPITSLYELERAILTTEKIETGGFEALRVGPLLKHPKVKDLFKPPHDLENVPEITAYQIQKHLMHFLSKTPRREGRQKHSIEDFLQFVCVKEGVESPEYLCIRITSFPLAIQVTHCIST